MIAGWFQAATALVLVYGDIVVMVGSAVLLVRICRGIYREIQQMAGR